VSDREEALRAPGAAARPHGARFARLLYVWGRAWRYVRPHEMLTALRAALLPLRGTRPRAGAPLVAVESVEEPVFFALFAALCDEMRVNGGARVELVVVRSVNAAVGTGLLPRLARSLPVVRQVSRHWIRGFLGIADGIAYRSQSLNPFGDLLDWWRSGSIWRRARASGSFHELKIDGVQVGDLVIDSYLRFRPRAIFQAEDRFTRRLLWQTCRDLRRGNR
jgi:hypothetical protein